MVNTRKKKMMMTQYKNSTSKVDHPSHYNKGGVETIDIIRTYLTADEYVGFLLGNVLKYKQRAQFKGGEEDLAKADWYIKRLEECQVYWSDKAMDEFVDNLERIKSLENA